jgi:hypothetical protein
MAAPLTPEDAARHIGETATVCGVVASAKYEVDAKSQPTLLDLGKPSPNATFTAVVYGENRAKFGIPEPSLRGKRICVTGKISNYQGTHSTGESRRIPCIAELQRPWDRRAYSRCSVVGSNSETWPMSSARRALPESPRARCGGRRAEMRCDPY